MENKNTLLIVDVQKGFINESTLFIPKAVQKLQEDYQQVFITKFINIEESPFRKLMSWHELSIGDPNVELAFRPVKRAIILEKTAYTCVDKYFLKCLENLTTVDICGIDTDACVMKCALDLFENGKTPRVLANYCASSGGTYYHKSALKILERNIGKEQIIYGKK